MGGGNIQNGLCTVNVLCASNKAQMSYYNSAAFCVMDTDSFKQTAMVMQPVSGAEREDLGGWWTLAGMAVNSLYVFLNREVTSSVNQQSKVTFQVLLQSSFIHEFWHAVLLKPQ
jgi:hypothetical protein